MEIILIGIGIILGFVVGYFLAQSKTSSLKSRNELLESRMEDARKSSEESLRQMESSCNQILEERENAYTRLIENKDRSCAEALEAKDKACADAIADRERVMEIMRQHFDDTVSKMKAEVENVTAEMLKRRQSEFEESSRMGVSKILEPLNTSIQEMRRAVADNTVKHSEFGGRLDANIRMVMEHSDAARKSADRLADALRGGGRIQGDWGEKVLSELLESQGLTEGIHFETQPTLRDEAGNAILSEKERRLRPDVILHLDRERDVVIDAKVSLSAYMDYRNAESEDIRENMLRNHVQSIENHVKELSTKNYSAYIGKGRRQMDYVIMFVPNTTALYAATLRKPDLWRKAMEKGVYIADEQTLYAALRIIDMTWRQIAQAENHEKVFGLANEMLDRVNMFMEKFQMVGRRLDEAQKSYNDAFGKLKDSGQSIPVTCRKLVALGASVKPRKGVDPALIGLSDQQLPLDDAL